MKKDIYTLTTPEVIHNIPDKGLLGQLNREMASLPYFEIVKNTYDMYLSASEVRFAITRGFSVVKKEDGSVELKEEDI